LVNSYGESHDDYVQSGLPSTIDMTVDLMQLVVAVGTEVSIECRIVTLTGYCVGLDEFGNYIAIDGTVTEWEESWPEVPQWHPGSADINLDNVVDLIDLGIVADNWGTGDTFQEGDLNADGTVDLIDLGRIADRWGCANASAVPEPGTIAMLLIGVVCLLGYRVRN